MKCISLILSSILIVFMTKAFPLPAVDGNLDLPTDFEMKSLKQIAEAFGYTLDGNGTLIQPSSAQLDAILNRKEAAAGITSLQKRDDWSYTCAKRIGPNPLIYWFSAFVYVADRLKKVPGICHVNPNDGCANCACTGGATVKLCRGGLSPPDFRVSNREVGIRAALVVDQFLLSFLGLAVCGGAWPGCTDPYNCQFEGLATNGGLSEGWYVYLTQERDNSKCIPI
ncbi:hypothetical protein TWF718_006872 [Orbilia javanica]|uniref:Uncharacterized protein n=1 Tax=Orbilia javanica TaxID=47235 RepID=A0AAN8RCR9_9PEZI